MCGIVGIWNSGGPPVNREELALFRDSLAHRGPDGSGAFFDDGSGLALGHRRLAVLDLSEDGKQPMSYADGRYWITHNGEIYNFLELQVELEKLGHRFRTRTDTEVILAAYAEWGPACLPKLNGMWAFAIWDRLERTLFLSRDRFGEKPCYWLQTPECFAFASELKAFASLPGRDLEPDWGVLEASIAGGFDIEHREGSLFKGVKKLLPGHAAIVKEGKLSSWRWWKTLEQLERVPKSFQDQTDRFRELFFDACRIRMRSDVPVATCLSGGLDSSSIVCAIADNRRRWAEGPKDRLLNEPQRAFVAVFPEALNDERLYAQKVVDKTGASAVFGQIDETEALRCVEEVVWAGEDIFFNFPAGIWLTYKGVRENGLFVTLDGHGADELLAGYPQHILAAVRSSGGLLRPLRLRSLLATLRGVYGRRSQWPEASFASLALLSTPRLRRAYAWARRIRGRAWSAARREENRSWLRRSGLGSDGRLRSETAHLDRFTAALYEDFHWTVLPTLLRIFDRMSMAHGVEIRMPFLDWRLVTFCFSLPMQAKLGEGATKRILRAAMKNSLPRSILARKQKIGFASPMGRWFQEGMSSWLLESVGRAEFLECDLWDGKAIRDFVAEKRRSGWDYHSAEQVWPFLNAAIWLRLLRSRRKLAATTS